MNKDNAFLPVSSRSTSSLEGRSRGPRSLALGFRWPHSWAPLPWVDLHVHQVEQGWESQDSLRGERASNSLEPIGKFLGLLGREGTKKDSSPWGNKQFLLDNDTLDTC